MVEVARYLLVAILVVVVLWQLWTGRARRENAEVVTREEKPGTYWLIVLSECVAIVFLLVIGAEE